MLISRYNMKQDMYEMQSTTAEKNNYYILMVFNNS